MPIEYHYPQTGQEMLDSFLEQGRIERQNAQYLFAELVYRVTANGLERIMFPVVVNPPRSLPELHLAARPCVCGARTVYCALDHSSICVKCGMPYRP